MEENKSWDKYYRSLVIGLYLEIIGASIFSVTDKAQGFREWRDNYLNKFETTKIGKICSTLSDAAAFSGAITFGVWSPEFTEVTKRISKRGLEDIH